jgi:hypothetical protein
MREICVGKLGLYLLQGRLRLAQGPLRLLPRRELGAEGGLGGGNPVDRRRAVRAVLPGGAQDHHGNLAVLGEAVRPAQWLAPRRRPLL